MRDAFSEMVERDNARGMQLLTAGFFVDGVHELHTDQRLFWSSCKIELVAYAQRFCKIALVEPHGSSRAGIVFELKFGYRYAFSE